MASLNMSEQALRPKPAAARRLRSRGLARWLLPGCAWVALLSGCTTLQYTRTLPLTSPEPDYGYRIPKLAPAHGEDEVFVFLSLSGGGMRASALAYGVLESLDAHALGTADGASLLDEVDLVHSVSGGSLVAAALALKGSDNFRELEPVLYKGLQRPFVGRWLSPVGLWRISQERYGRSDLLQENLDELFFAGATYGTLTQAGRRPFVVIRATDMSQGEAFDFTQHNLSRFCSSLADVPLARAVAASMAVPVVLSPVTIEGHSANCAVAGSERVGSDPRPYVHLIDGGLVDNLGVRGPVDYVDRAGGFGQAARANGLKISKKIAFIVVNSETLVRHREDDRASTPGILRTLNAWIDIPIRRSSTQNLNLLRDRIAAWEREAISPDGSLSDFYYIEVNLRGTGEASLMQRLNAIPTALTLEASDIDLLRQFAGTELGNNPEFQRLIRDVGAVKVSGSSRNVATPK